MMMRVLEQHLPKIHNLIDNLPNRFYCNQFLHIAERSILNSNPVLKEMSSNQKRHLTISILKKFEALNSENIEAVNDAADKQTREIILSFLLTNSSNTFRINKGNCR